MTRKRNPPLPTHDQLMFVKRAMLELEMGLELTTFEGLRLASILGVMADSADNGQFGDWFKPYEVPGQGETR